MRRNNMYIGIDLGGTNIVAGIVDENGMIKYQESAPTINERTPDAIIQDIINLIHKVTGQYGISKGKVNAIGIGIPGLVDIKTGNVAGCVNLNWKDVPLASVVENALQIPVFINNDATLAGLAEFEAGIMKGCQSGILLTLGTGIGGGIILNGQIYDGAHGVASEIGHMVVGENFYNCNCGKNGCLETFASSTAIIKYTKKLMVEEKIYSSIFEKLNRDLEKLDGKIIFDAAKEGDAVANKVINRMAKYLGIGIVNLINTIDPDIFVIGGGLSKAGTFLLEKVRSEVNKNIHYKTIAKGKIELSQLGNDAGLIGAALLGKNRNL